MDHSNHTTLLQPGGQTAISERMRELLARAAQDHVYEQRTQGAVLDEIRQRLEGMEWLLREVRERELGGLSGTLATVSGRLDDIAAKPPMWAEGLAQHVEAVRDHVDAVGEQVGEVDSAVESVGKRVHPVMELPKLRADVTAVCEGMEETLGRLQTVLDFTGDLAGRMGDVTAKLAQVSTSMEAAAGRFTRLDKSLAELNARTDRVEGVVLDLSATFDERIANATQEVGARVEELGQSMSGRFDGVDGRVDRVESRLMALDARFETAEESLADVDARLRGMDGRVTTHTNRLDALHKHLTAHTGRFDTIDARLAAHAGRFDVLDEELTAHTGWFDAIDTRLTGRFDAVDERLTAHGGRFDTIDARLAAHAGRFDAVDERLTAQDQRLEAAEGRQEERFTGLDGRLGQAEERLTHRVDGLDAHLTGLNTRAEQAGEALEAVGRRIDGLPAALGIGKLLDTHGERLTEAAASLAETVRSRPDRDTLAETVSDIVEPATTDLTKRLGALEETMLALAEALLRPSRSKD
ncbi:hypothetical protein OUY22_03640 [Nonomuraea sp. MCN248]|uniref:t-SNARE coiled-coil homology domain-containing protein n=1 Tax=Nonomuraea corallina TaxID=2989783 RepID=A0ABT4S5N5_9ACTN|nr:hypothetical protein [Nonomuraea corallina]MDA0632496.1 hypothetical protein [Nonomuraea corallina]